jgi:CheY-like chemotaxis protein
VSTMRRARALRSCNHWSVWGGPDGWARIQRTGNAADEGDSRIHLRGSPLKSVRILIVDDHAEVRRALHRLLTLESWHVCAEAADGVEAIQAVRQHHPDVVVMDVSMPQMSGIQAAVEIRTQSPTTLIMLISANRLSEREVRETGARGSLSKCALNRVTDGINAMLRGEEFYAMTAAPDRDD